jgi:hypothetical protein
MVGVGAGIFIGYAAMSKKISIGSFWFFQKWDAGHL